MNQLNDNSKLLVIEAAFIILVMTFMIRASNNMLMTTVPLLTKYSFGFSETEVGIIEALMSAAGFLTTAFLNTRLNPGQRRFAFITSTFMYTLILVGFWLSNTFSVWLLGVASGAVLGLIMPNIITSASLFSDIRTRERILSLYTVALSVSLIAGPAVESYILKLVPLKEAFLLFSLFGVAATIISPMIRFPKEPITGEKTKVWSNSGFQASVYNNLAYGIPFYVLITFGGIYEVEQFHISLSLVSLLFSLFFLTSFLGRLYYSFKPPKSIKHHMTLAVSLTLIGIIFMIEARSLPLFMVSLMVLGVPHGLTYPLSVLSLSRAFKPQQRNVANSWFFSLNMLIGIILPLVSGFFIERVGFKNSFLGILAVVVVIMILMFDSFRRWKISDSRTVS